MESFPEFNVSTKGRNEENFESHGQICMWGFHCEIRFSGGPLPAYDVDSRSCKPQDATGVDYNRAQGNAC